ncbi:VOC family protein [Paracoccus aurantiacus]|uniref:VOC family protein n=1 Tax=Paracoccus aurantiacus TaxID=2599412 RepID=A0A5C6S5E4_9RHOB|nr:VOC family protein [Paracoccus aurantiacus]TXB69653.1 VOC family protein [Paracoccus aurantiacus]
MNFTPYLSFQGQAADAFTFYGKVFGGTPVLNRFSDIPAGGDMPPLPEEQRNWVMHAQLTLDDGAILMGADMPPQFGGQKQAGVSVAVWRADAEGAKALFEQLAEGGEVTMPFSETFFSKGFGMCRDRFGTAWMVSTGDPAVPQ